MVTSRVGSAEPRRLRWGMSTTNQATFYPESRIALIRQLMTAERFVVETTPYRETRIMAEFDAGGLAEQIAPLRRACNW